MENGCGNCICLAIYGLCIAPLAAAVLSASPTLASIKVKFRKERSVRRGKWVVVRVRTIESRGKWRCIFFRLFDRVWH